MTVGIGGQLIIQIADEDLQQILKERKHMLWQVDDLQRRNTELVEEKRALQAKLVQVEEQLRIAREK